MSGTITTIAGTVQQATSSAQALSNLPGNAARTDNTGTSWSGSAWWAQLQPGSWRGVGFVMDVAETHAGRRVAIHEYPYRDTAWVEDLGKLPRQFMVQAYLVGDDVYAQRDAMVRACEQAGSGTLVHPTMGSVTVVLLDFSVQDRRERGRYVEIALHFMLAGDVRYPATAISSAAAVTKAAHAVNQASAADLSTTLASFPTGIANVATQVNGFTGLVTSALGDASRIIGSVRGLVGTFGRYASGRRMTTLDPLATAQSVLSDATRAVTLANTTAASVTHLASLL